MAVQIGSDYWRAGHYVFRDGEWLGYSNAWKARWPTAAVRVRGPSLGAIAKAIREQRALEGIKPRRVRAAARQALKVLW